MIKRYILKPFFNHSSLTHSSTTPFWTYSPTNYLNSPTHQECFDSLTSLFQWAWSTFCTLGIRLSSEQLLTSSLSVSSQESTISQEFSQISKSISPPTATCLKTFQPKNPPAPPPKKPLVCQPPSKPHNHMSHLERELMADELKRLTYVCNTCLYLINTYLKILYPSNSQSFKSLSPIKIRSFSLST